MLLNKLKIVAVVVLTAVVLTFSAGTRTVPTAAAGGEKGSASRNGEPAEAGEPREAQVRFGGPAGMKIRVLTAPGRGDKGPLLVVPGRLDLVQGTCYRLKLTDVPNRPGVELFPTLEIPREDAATEQFVARAVIPVEFTNEDFDHVNGGELVTKVIYLENGTRGRKPSNRSGEPVVTTSYDCEPGIDVIAEATRRGAVLAVVRIGNIDLGADEPEQGPGRAVRPAGKAAPPVEIRIGDDSTRGRVPRGKDNVGARDDDRADRLAARLEDVMRDLAAVQGEVETLRQRLKAAELEARSLRDALERKERESKKAKGSNGM